MFTWITGLANVVAVFSTVTSSAEAGVPVLGGSFLADASIVARILSASLAVSDSNALRLVAVQVDLFFTDDQSADASNESTDHLRMLVDGVIGWDSPYVHQLLHV